MPLSPIVITDCFPVISAMALPLCIHLPFNSGLAFSRKFLSSGQSVFISKELRIGSLFYALSKAQEAEIEPKSLESIGLLLNVFDTQFSQKSGKWGLSTKSVG